MELEKIKNATINEIEERMEEIRSLDLDKEKDLRALDKEVDALKERKEELRKSAKSKEELRTKILNGDVEVRTIDKPKEERKMELNKDNYLSSKEYRSAFLKNLQGKELNVQERAAMALAGTNPVIPEQLQEPILTKAKEYAPVLNDITLLTVNGAVKFAVEGTNNEAIVHTENANITPSNDSFVEVELSTYEIVKMIQISASVNTMSIDSFETWLIDNLSESLAIKIENLVFNGTGSSQAKGVNKIEWQSSNSVTVTADGSLTAAKIFALVGLLKTGYSRNAKFYMNRQTLFNDFLPLEDKSKNSLVVREGENYYILGIKVETTDSVLTHEAILGDMKRYVANLAEAITVKNAFDINTNSYKYLGVANFDGKPSIEEAFVKLVKETSSN